MDGCTGGSEGGVAAWMGASRVMGVEGCACGGGLTILAGILHILSNHEVSMS